MSQHRSMLIGAALSLLAATGYNLVRPTHGPGRPPPIQDVLQHHHDALDLAPQTLAEAWDIADAAKPELDAYHEQIRGQRQQLEAQLDTSSTVTPSIEATIARIGELETELRTRELETMLDIRSLLTDQQVRALKTLPPPPSSRPR